LLICRKNRAASHHWAIPSSGQVGKIHVALVYKDIPIGSMYGIYSNIGDILMVNVTIYSIHGSYGIDHFHQFPNVWSLRTERSLQEILVLAPLAEFASFETQKWNCPWLQKLSTRLKASTCHKPVRFRFCI
jgi:hypothetical protein